jgi:elongation factor Ts
MSKITPAMIKELRERTQAGMADCKNALEEAAGDLDKAVEVILKKGIVKAAARAGRVATEGEIRTWVSADKKRAAIVEVNCQTDFVARGDEFKNFVTKVTEVASKLAKGKDLGAEKYPGTDKSIDTVRQELVAKTGENTVVRRWDLLEAKDAGTYMHAYVHPGSKYAALVHADAPSADALKNKTFLEFVDNAAMQVVSMKAVVVRKEDLSPAQIEKQKEIYQAQLKEEKKPEQAWPKIIEGKLAKWFTEVTLLGQANVWDQENPTATVDQKRQELSKSLGGEVKIVSFVSYALGEGIEKKTDDLAEEVAKMTGG